MKHINTRKFTFLFIFGTMVVVSIAFVSVEKFLPDGWYYVPATANLSDNELNDTIQKYGSPNDYYN